MAAGKMCPHCFYVYYYPQKTLQKSQRPMIGSPFLVCEQCGKGFTDDTVLEPALYPEQTREKRVQKFTLYRLVFSIVLTAGFVLAVGSELKADPGVRNFIWLFVFLIAVSLLLFLKELFTYRKRLVQWQNEYDQSAKRLANADYLEAVKKLYAKA